MPDTAKRSMWVEISTHILSGFVAAIFAAFIFGGARQKVVRLGTDVDELKPRVERMDHDGSYAFGYFKNEYSRTQAKQEEKLKELEKDIRQLERERKP